LGSVTFPLLQQHLEAILLVSDEEAAAAQQLCFEHTELWIEPSSAVVLAALQRYPEYFQGQRVGAIISGGNVIKN
ncbi:MAG TPA: pyridoxal-phosphate dependent enzyme, partial [Pseudidiomarina sp.]|nr:pyridoxal-phosphate dependent enzyme [Pseudidiomarina sp.]